MNLSLRQFIRFKVRSNLKAEASRNYLGFLWWLVEPMLLLGTFYLVFAELLPFGRENFASYLLIGISAWILFANTVTHATNSIQSAAGLIQQVYVPKWVFPCIVVINDSVKFAFLLVVLFCFVGFDGSLKTAQLWGVIPVFFALFIFVCGSALVVAAITPFIPDLKFVISAAIQLLMFTSGIFYQYSLIPPQYWNYFMMNPLANAIYQLREVMLNGNQPEWASVGYIAILGLLLILLGTLLLIKWDRRYPRVVV